MRLMTVFYTATSCRLTTIGGGSPMTEKNNYKQEIISLSSDKVLYRLISTINNAWNKGLNDVADDFLCVLDKLYPDEFDEAVKVHRYVNALHSWNVSRRAKKKRLHHKLVKMSVEGSLSFVTLTFNPETLEMSSFHQRKDLVKECLDSYCQDWVANIDFGEKKGREHYHAFCLNLNPSFIAVWNEAAGFCKLEPVCEVSSRLCEYIDKLCNHALKESVGFHQLMYCHRHGSRA